MICRWFMLMFAMQAAAASTTAAEPVDYQTQIQPIFVERCAKCHGEKLGQGRMRLHTAEALRAKWDAKQEILVPGAPASSILYQRLVLPADDKKRMPKNADPLPKEEIELIAKWIEEGAKLPAAAAVLETREEVADDEPQEAKPEELELPEVEAAPQEAIDRLVDAGAQVTPLFTGSPLLDVSFSQRSESAGDAEIMLLAGVAHQVHSLNLVDAEISDVGAALLAALKNLSRLHLERSTVTDAGLAHLSGLERLEYLNLYGTEIGDAGLAHLESLKNLKNLYVWQTKVSYEAAKSLEEKSPGLVVNLGFDHPVVVRERLTRELELMKNQIAEAKADEEKAKRLVESAEQNLESLNSRITEVEKELKELDGDGAEESAPANDE